MGDFEPCKGLQEDEGKAGHVSWPPPVSWPPLSEIPLYHHRTEKKSKKSKKSKTSKKSKKSKKSEER